MGRYEVQVEWNVYDIVFEAAADNGQAAAMIRTALRWLAVLFFAVAGLMHFLRPAPYLKIMPPWIPWHAAMVAISGAAEMAGGIGLAIPKLRRAAAWGLVALLVAVFPANIYMATDHVSPGATPIPVAFLWVRLLFQPLMIWWVLWCSPGSRT
jgi:uncharacterized membrane protein